MSLDVQDRMFGAILLGYTGDAHDLPDIARMMDRLLTSLRDVPVEQFKSNASAALCDALQKTGVSILWEQQVALQGQPRARQRS